MLGDKPYEDPITEHVLYCSCDRGKQLKKHIANAERRGAEEMLDAIKGFIHLGKHDNCKCDRCQALFQMYSYCESLAKLKENHE